MLNNRHLAAIAVLLALAACGPERREGEEECVPATCESLGRTCGEVSDGCGGTLACGGCETPQECGGGGVDGVCGDPSCVPETDAEICARLSATCGPLNAMDGCATVRTVACGTCSAGTCTDNRCVGAPGGAPPGGACARSADCAGGARASCLTGIAGGTCTVKGCTLGGNDCGEGAICIQFSDGNYCIEGPCRTNQDCSRRAEGFFCDEDQSCWWKPPATCNPETNAAFCTRLGAQCGTKSGTDNCGQARSVNCGGCSTGTCSQNRCTTPSSPDAPFQDFAIWRDGCSNQLWGRWTNTGTFSLLERTIRRPDGSATQTSYGDPVGFRNGLFDAFLLSDSGDNGPGSYTVEMTVEESNGGVRTVAMTRTAENTLYRGTPMMTVLSARNGLSDGLTVSVRPDFSGSVQRIMRYRASDSCLTATKTYYSEPRLIADVGTEINLGGTYPTGTQLVVAVEGIDQALGYTYYTTIEVTAP